MSPKKLVIFTLVIIVLFGALYSVNAYTTNKKLEGNPYGTNNLKPSTIGLLNNPNYQNIILPEELEQKLDQEEDVVYVYFFSPECPSCMQATPGLMEKAAEQDIYINQYNVLEFTQGWRDYRIEGTPTLIAFKDGQEVQRAVGLYSAEEYGMFFEYVAEITQE